MKIVLLESLGIPRELLDRYAARLATAGHEFDAYERNTDPQVQIERAKDADVIMIANMPLAGEVIRACRKLKVIDVAYDLGFGSVDGYQRAFRREFGCNPAEYARQPVPITLFVPYGVKFRNLRKEP